VPLFRRLTPERRRVGLRVHEPVSTQFGLDRGRPVDRFYIERFLEQNKELIRGRVLEVQERTYTDWFGTGVEQSDVLHAAPGNPEATVVGDLTTGEGIPQDAYDCIILTQTLPFIYDVPAVIATLYRILKPGGIVLATMGGVTQTSRSATDRWNYCWGFSTQSARRLFEEWFPPASVFVESFGNVLAATAFLQGLATEDLRAEELDHHDPDYEFLIGVTAVKPPATGSA
jgi:SAM-dependent methyltransferase